LKSLSMQNEQSLAFLRPYNIPIAQYSIATIAFIAYTLSE